MAFRDALRPPLEMSGETKPGDLPTWQMVAQRREEARDQMIRKYALMTIGLEQPSLPPPSARNVQSWPLVSGNLNPRQIKITEATPTEILTSVAEGAWSAVEVLSSFIGRTIIAHHLTNPLADVRFEQALERARYLDRYLAENGRTIGPLHGLPMTIKDAFDIEGLPTSLGFVALEDNVAHVDDDLVQRLTSAGAIFFTKTNVPQSLMSGECANLLFGRTASPYNVTLSAGGSSGGEGSLIALGGSPLGVGSDIAGSIRTPANFNGIYGLCPSYGRLPCRNPQRSHSNLIINGVAGPMSRSIDGLEVYVKALLSTKPWEWDSSVVEMPWDQSKFESAQGVDGAKLCFGFVAHDGVVQPHPPIVRGMEELKRSIAQDGHSTIDIDFFDGDDRLWETALKIFSRDGGTELRGTAARYNEPLLPETMVPSPGDTLSLLEYFEVARNIQSFRQKYLQRLDATRTMTRTGRPVDALILPSGAHVAPPHGTMSYWLYEAISNVLDWTCATIPVGFVDEQVDEVQQPQPCMPLTPEDSANQAMYSVSNYTNAPICLQVLGSRFGEERVLGYLRVLGAALGRSAEAKDRVDTPLRSD